MFVYEKGLIDGIEGVFFRPDEALTRAQAAVRLYRMAGSPAVSGDSPFSDVEKEAKQNGIMMRLFGQSKTI